MKRTPRPSAHRSLFPALVTVFAAACNRTQPPPSNPPAPENTTTPEVSPTSNPPAPPMPTVNPPPPELVPPMVNPPPPPVDAGVTAPPVRPPVTQIDPARVPHNVRGGLRAVSPRPAAAPRTAARGAGLGRAAAASPTVAMAEATPQDPQLAGRPPGLYVVHNHPPGTPCTDVSEREVQAALAR